MFTGQVEVGRSGLERAGKRAWKVRAEEVIKTHPPKVESHNEAAFLKIEVLVLRVNESVARSSWIDRQTYLQVCFDFLPFRA